LIPPCVREHSPPATRRSIRVPPDTREGALAELAPRSPAAKASRRALATREIHVVRPQETVSSIAKLYGLSVTDVLRWNRLESQDHIRPGDRLRIAQLR